MATTAVIPTVLAIMLFTAIFLMLHASSLFLQYNGPFIVGSVLYLGLGAVAFILWLFVLGVEWLSEEKTKISAQEIKMLAQKIETLAENIKMFAQKIEMPVGEGGEFGGEDGE